MCSCDKGNGNIQQPTANSATGDGRRAILEGSHARLPETGALVGPMVPWESVSPSCRYVSAGRVGAARSR